MPRHGQAVLSTHTKAPPRPRLWRELRHTARLQRALHAIRRHIRPRQLLRMKANVPMPSADAGPLDGPCGDGGDLEYLAL